MIISDGGGGSRGGSTWSESDENLATPCATREELGRIRLTNWEQTKLTKKLRIKPQSWITLLSKERRRKMKGTASKGRKGGRTREELGLLRPELNEKKKRSAHHG